MAIYADNNDNSWYSTSTDGEVKVVYLRPKGYWLSVEKDGRFTKHYTWKPYKTDPYGHGEFWCSGCNINQGIYFGGYETTIEEVPEEYRTTLTWESEPVWVTNS